MSVIELRNVTKAYYTTRKKNEARVVLDDVSFEVNDSEFVCLVGPSGCGKTTILNMIAGFERSTLGNVLFKDKTVTSPAPERGVVFQDYSLFPWMSVLKNIDFALECKGVPEKKRNDIAMEVLRKVGLEDSADQRPNLLSGGMKQRVAIARLLATDSEIMLMDEPFSNLDEQTRKKLDEDLLRIWEEKKKTIIFVTHNIQEALLLADRILLFTPSPGRLIKEWVIARNGVRDIESEDMIKLKREIADAMLPCNCIRGFVKTEVK